jgi:hypothetical protein
MDQIRSPTVVRTMKWDGASMSREILLSREWLVTNGLGRYAAGTISGAITRRYHGLLIAALPAARAYGDVESRLGISSIQ